MSKRAGEIEPPVETLIERHAGGICTVDAGFHRPQMASLHIVVDSGRAAFVDAGTSHSVPLALAALEALGLGVEAVDYVLTTHVHLDHAGGAGALLRHLPEARVVVHPRGARHLIDPSRLVAGATAIYGAEEMARTYGEVVPVPAERVVQAPEGHQLRLGARTLHFLDTPGHARHHYCVWDRTASAVFTGDSYGLAYPWFTTAAGPWLLPTTTPVHFDPEAMHATFRRLAGLGADTAYLTHWGAVPSPAAHLDGLRRRLDAMVRLAEAHADHPDRHSALVEALFDWVYGQLDEHGVRMSRAAIRERLALDVGLNASGMEVWLDRR